MDAPAESAPKFQKGYFWLMVLLFGAKTIWCGVFGVTLLMLADPNSPEYPFTARTLLNGVLPVGGIIAYWGVFWSLVWSGANQRRAPGWLFFASSVALTALILGTLWIAVVDSDGFLWALVAAPSAAGMIYALFRAN